jgi:hypothetical protein
MNKITLIPNDETLFKKQLLLTKLATRIIIYKDGSTKESVWGATKLNSGSDIMRNIMSQSWYRDEKNNIEHAIIIAGRKLNGSSRIDGYKKRGPEQKPVATPWQGKDVETERIKYGNVPEEQQVPQLCRCLEGVYERILAFAREILGDWVDSLKPRRIPIILKKECPSNVYVHKDEYVQRRINELIKCGEEVSLEEMRRILRHTMRIAGSFVSKPEPHIIIYFNQFSSKCWDEYISQVAQTLAHEYMHYLEYAHCRDYGTTSYKDENVSEALADFFAVLFSIGCNDGYSLAVAKDRYDCWMKWDGSGWPYAFALYFYTVKGIKRSFSSSFADYITHGSINKTLEVFHATPDAVDAYNKLTKL